MSELKFRFAEIKDTDLYFNWANDIDVRQNSYNQEAINYENHVKWFKSKLNSNNCFFYLFLNNSEDPVGQVRIDKNEEIIIGISVDKKFRGKNLSSQMIRMASDDFLKNNTGAVINAYIKENNEASYKSFINAGFIEKEVVLINNHNSYKLCKKI
ncbi:MAG: GNAT family N-acetyltransferase [Bacteroidia bacterium]|nr:GNAT family N-acetyltransferase [Bacteroidia bacterium]